MTPTANLADSPPRAANAARADARLRRHWRELMRLALDAPDALACAMLHPHARGAELKRLEARMFGARSERLALAACPYAPSAVLARLCMFATADADSTLATRLARHAATPADGLQTLAASLEGLMPEQVAQRFAQLIARHPLAPPALLQKIAAHADSIETLRSLCENVGVQPDLLAQLAGRGIAPLQRLLAIHFATDARTLNQLWHSTRESAVRAQVLRHRACPDELLRTVPASSAERRSLASNVRTADEILTALARDDDPAVRRAAATNPATPAGALVLLCFDADSLVRRAVAVRDDLPLKVVEWLAEDGDVWVRSSLARNRACPRSWLDRLARDPDADVRRSVTRHAGCPIALLTLLASDEVAWVRAGVALRDELPGSVLHRLLQDDDIDVLAGVARHRGTPQATLARLAQHASPDVRRAVILNRHAQRRVLLPLRDESYPLHRVLVFMHPSLTDADRWRMRFEPDMEARARMYGHLAGTLAAARERERQQGRTADEAGSTERDTHQLTTSVEEAG
ncbi:hypothetical protein PPMP20_00940 [Paraburkholderia phymatum]|uniref:Leucine rich repeat variant n=1 Tax=Paraburkholderia phymatum (strain DSM 17167 / CIP 108236 / LMG 21445 / STM815) TaxID=391038 RepID=B2JVP5_PARP8|nr:hypothetical protein [Paraburkholderia phymatum]ACC75022.1 leucine rich repeat variant [Paraburkholderia phymatum STM815]